VKVIAMNTDKIALNIEERALLKSIENNEWKTVKNINKEKFFAKNAAENFLRKEARINIRISQSDLKRLKQLAAYEGLPYQTLISSILHKHASGHGAFKDI
jgi:predicted DNA binding CopG/RHH family protein